MGKLNHIVSHSLGRWRHDLRELTGGVLHDPFAERRGRRWDRDFGGDVGPADVHYAIFLGVLSLIPAAVVAYTSSAPDWLIMANFFRAPLQVAVSGFLTSVLIFAGSHFNQVPRPYSVAFKVMLRIMSIHPLLGFLLFSRFGEPLAVLIYGFFVVRGVRKTYLIPVRNALLLFGTIYFMFAVMQLRSVLNPPSPDRFKDYSELKSVPPSRATMRTSSSSKIEN